MATLLDQLRGLSSVDCDTLDLSVAAKLGPFSDCTSNQAIALAELSKVGADGHPLHQTLIVESIQAAHWLFGKQSDATLKELAIELMMVGLSLRFAPHLTGYHHVQTNPKLAYSTQKTVKNAERILSHFSLLSAGFDKSRVCVKIPATWEGLQACRELEKKGISTLATTLFSMEQVALAGEAGCRYIAPYVNELRVHFDTNYVDTNKAFGLCGIAQQYLEGQETARKTQVMPASLTSIDEVMQLAGMHHITVSPPLLSELGATPAAGWHGLGSIGKVAGSASPVTDADVQRLHAIIHDESRWRLDFTRSDGGKSETKLIQALNIFCDTQDSLEELARKNNSAATATS